MLVKNIQVSGHKTVYVLFPDYPVFEVCLQGDRTSTSSVIHFLMKWKLASGMEKKKRGEKGKINGWLSEKHGVKQWD